MLSIFKFVASTLSLIILLELYSTESKSISNQQQYEQKCLREKTSNYSDLEKYRRDFGEQMYSYMDTFIDPCDNFYEYACGNWEAVRGFNKYEPILANFFVDIEDQLNNKIHRLLNSSNIVKEFPELRNAQSFWESCMKTDIYEYSQKRVPEYLSFLKSIGGFPAADPNWNKTEFNWMKMLAIADIFDDSLFFGSKFNPNYPFQPAFFPEALFGLNRALVVDEDEIKQPQSKVYKTLQKVMYKLLRTYCFEEDSKKCGKEKINKIIEKIFELGRKFLHLNIKVETRDMYNTTEEFLISSQQWEIYLKNKFQVDQVNRSLPIFAGPRNLFLKLSNLLEKTDKEVIANLLSLKILYILHAENRFPKFQDKFCMDQVRFQFSYSIGRAYSQYYWHNQTEDISRMFNEMKSIFITLIENSIWLDNSTRHNAITKVNKMSGLFGCAQHPILDTLAKVINENTIISENFFNNNIQAWFIKNKLNHYYYLNDVDPMTPSKEAISPTETNAFYNGVLNTVTICAGIFQKPLYDQRFPAILKYGFIGQSIGHEISHSFDSKNRFVNEKGKKKLRWSNHADDEYFSKSECFIHQYDSFYFPEVGISVDGEASLAENIADNIGLKLAYLAYIQYLQENGFNCDEHAIDGVPLTNMQLFFVAHAQQYCVTYFRRHFIDEVSEKHPFMMARANGPVQNSKEFSNAFNCKPNSPMNPKTKCEIF